MLVFRVMNVNALFGQTLALVLKTMGKPTSVLIGKIPKTVQRNSLKNLYRSKQLPFKTNI